MSDRPVALLSGPLQHRVAVPLYVSLAVTYVLASVLIAMLGLAPSWLVLAPPALFLLLYLTWRWPLYCLLLLMLLLPFQPAALLCMKFFHFPDVAVTVVSGTKEMVMALLFVMLALRGKHRLILADWFLLSLLFVSICVALFSGNPDLLVTLKDDFSFVLAYAVGRVLVTSEDQQAYFVGIGTAVLAFVAVLGIIEFLFVGSAPRLLVADINPNQFYAGTATLGAEGLQGSRAASTLSSPIEFGHMCVMGLLLLAGYRRLLKWPYIVATAALSGGLIASVTRSAWLAVLVGFTVIALRTRQKAKFFSLFALAVLALFAVAPYIGMSDFLSLTLERKESSLVGHEQSVVEMTQYLLEHPFGSGPGTVGNRALQRTSAKRVLEVESSYIYFGLEYGVIGSLLFLGFCLLVVFATFRKSSPLGVAASALAINFLIFSGLMSPPFDFPSAAWTWIPIGMAATPIAHLATPHGGMGG